MDSLSQHGDREAENERVHGRCVVKIGVGVSRTIRGQAVIKCEAMGLRATTAFYASSPIETFGGEPWRTR